LDWKRIKAEYIAGGTSYRKLAEKYGVSFNTLKTRAREEQWYELRQQKDHKTTTKVIESLSDKESEIDDKYFRIVDKLLNKAEATVDAVDEWHPTLLKEMATTMKYLKDCKGIKSEADMREQEARIAKLRKEAEDDTPEDREVNVTFIGDIEEYSK
jgi:uncharacterized protein YjcR